MDGRVDPDFDDWYIAAGLVSLLVYGIISWRYYSRYKRFIVQEFSFADSVTFRWVRNFLIAFFIYFTSNLVFHLVQLAGVEINYTGTWWYYLLFALLFYYIAINGYSNSIETRMRFHLDLLAHQRTPLLAAGGAPPEGDEFISYEEVPESSKEQNGLEEWKPRIEQLMAVEKHYRNPELTLTDLARTLGTNTVLLSRVINKGFGKNFNDFINSYRVQEVQERLAGPDSSQYTIMSLAYEAGFNSKATFNRAFKKLTGKNPSDLIS
jgi:AraC-like DNA-binding protein